MRLLDISLLALSLPALGGWREVMESTGLDASNVVALEGASAEAQGHGFIATGEKVDVRSVTDTSLPSLRIVWERPSRVARFLVPDKATVFTRERWTGAPLAAGFREGGKVVFWTATGIGEKGYERYPYIPQALVELGLQPKVETRGLWAFFDSSYRQRADPEYLAVRWRKAGIAALQLAAWHYWEADQARDEWLRSLMGACHRQAIHVYAWVELPHVSETFWEAHPEWREKTATGQDAHLDWRKLMNLADGGCAAAVEKDLRGLMSRFDWDGINLGELYFESLEGYLNPARFTPFNEPVRREFAAQHGVDPRDFFDPAAKAYHLRDIRPLRKFLDYRARLAHRLQGEWLERIDRIRNERRDLDVVLTHVDDRFDTAMRDALGADAASLLPLAAQHGATFLVEDPATIWNLGPDRYVELSKRYARIAPEGAALGADINIVERYQDVYPTKQQTGAELFQLLHAAAQSFPRVAIYFENSIMAPDWGLLGAAAAPAKWEIEEGKLVVVAAHSVAVRWQGCAKVDGKIWPLWSAGGLLVPRGRHVVEACPGQAAPRLADFNGDLIGMEEVNGRVRIEYESRARAIVVLAGERQRVAYLPAGRRVEWLDPVERRPGKTSGPDPQPAKVGAGRN